MDPLEQVMDALARGWVVVTGNQRSARSHRHLYDRRQRQQGAAYWQPPAVFAWDSWLASLWRGLLLNGHATALLLNSSQEHALWCKVIGDDPAASSMRSIDSLAELGAAAWSRLHAYGAAGQLMPAANTADSRAFAHWADGFDRHCRRNRCLSAAQLATVLAEAIRAGRVELPAGILLVGFDFILPAQTGLLDALRNTGVAVEDFVPSSRQAQLVSERHIVTDCADRNGELETCARWLRDQLRDTPDARIGVIVSDLDGERANIERAFRNSLAPELNDIALAAGSEPFEFSLGVPLDRTAMAAVALDILRLGAGPLLLDRVSRLLLSHSFDAYGAAQGELRVRAEFDAFVLRNRTFLEPQISLNDLAHMVSHSPRASQLSSLDSRLRAMAATVRRSDIPRERSYTAWAEVFQALLDAAGWAQPAQLDSIEFQTRRRWEGALDELATLDFGPEAVRVPLRAALDSLSRIAAQTLFAAESRQAPIQIMGPLEAAGSTFDALWVLRATDATLRTPPSLNPLLPYSLQRDFGMPGADADRDMVLARRMMHRLIASAPVVVFSYAQQTNDGPQRPSSLLADLDLLPAKAGRIASAGEIPVPIVLDKLLDDAPITPLPVQTLTGGASVLQLQAACPFRAFAERRLFASSLDDVSMGFDARERGNVVHNVLHAFWGEVRSQAALRAMTSGERDTVLARSIDAALNNSCAHAAAAWPAAYLGAERTRLMRLLRHWLDFEDKQRSPFVVKSREEQIKDVQIGPLRLDIRVDRVDQTVPSLESPGDPAEVILDYKTGPADPSDWEGDRPNSPQLPLYAVLSKAPKLAAVAFASVRPGNFIALSGYQSQQGALGSSKNKVRNMEDQRKGWSDVLEKLAWEFHDGRAFPSPNHYPETCTYCKQRLLCRLNLDAIELREEQEDLEDVGSPRPAPAPLEQEGRP